MQSYCTTPCSASFTATSIMLCWARLFSNCFFSFCVAMHSWTQLEVKATATSSEAHCCLAAQAEGFHSKMCKVLGMTVTLTTIKCKVIGLLRKSAD